MLTSICSISRQSGALSTRSIIRHSAYMLTIGRILDESRISSIILAKKSARIGNPVLSLPNIMKAARIKQAARAATDGKSKSIILSSIKLNRVRRSRRISLSWRPILVRAMKPRLRSNALEVLSALTITRLKKKGSQN